MVRLGGGFFFLEILSSRLGGNGDEDRDGGGWIDLWGRGTWNLLDGAGMGG